MATSDERREVAERLRKAADSDEWLDLTIENAIFGVFGEVRRPAADTLADLIDPTCHAALERAAHVMRCDACGLWFERFAVSTDGGDDWQPTRYCPSCGARVYGNGEGRPHGR